jgi:hypothetical protein
MLAGPVERHPAMRHQAWVLAPRSSRECERSVTSQGSAHSRFRRALTTGNPVLIRSAARELPRIDLPDALAVCVALAAAGDEGFSRAAARFQARWSTELSGVSLEEAQALGSALQALGNPETALVGRRVLAELAAGRGMPRARH